MRGTTIASLFTYKPPMLNLSGIEQEQLFYALGGNTDHELSAILNISYATVRKRWDSVYGKVATCVPHIFIEGYTPELLSGRGCEKRRRVLRYIQFHREELRPYEH
jgi:DNA-binding CsgD family transcriptional regulator